MTDFDNFSKSYKNHTQTLARLNTLNKAAIFEALAAAKVTRITVEFDGEGDSGQLDKIAAYAGDEPTKLPATSIALRRAEWNHHRFTTHADTLEEAIETLCYDYLQEKHDGWETNEGAHGTFEFDVANRTVSLEFNARFVDTTTYNHTF